MVPSRWRSTLTDNLYVANMLANTVSVFAPGSTTPTSTLTGGSGLPGLNGPTNLAFDGNGNLYVSTASEFLVSVFAPKATTPTSAIGGLHFPQAIAIDAAGNVYVCSGTNVSVIAPGNTSPTSVLTGMEKPVAIAFDAHGDIFVADAGTNEVDMFAPGATRPSFTIAGVNDPRALAFDSSGRLFVASGLDNTISMFSTPSPTAGGVMLETAQPGESISIGGASGSGLILSDAELADFFTASGGAVTIGDSGQTGDIAVTGLVARHAGFDTLILQTPGGAINAAGGAVLSVANLALQAGIGIGTTGATAIDATHLAFASQSGAIQLSDTNPVTLTSVGPVSASSIPGDVFSAAKVGDSFTLLHTGGGVTGQVTYNGGALAEDGTLTLADGNHYRIDYTANGGVDVTLTRIASLTLPPPVPPSPGPGAGTGSGSGSGSGSGPRSGSTTPPAGVTPAPAPEPGSGPTPFSVAVAGTTLVITESAGVGVTRLRLHDKALRAYARFLPAVIRSYLPYMRSYRGAVNVALGDVTGDGIADIITGNDRGPARVKIFDGRTGKLIRALRPFGMAERGGVKVTYGHFGLDGEAEVVASQSHGGSKVRVFDARELAAGAEVCGISTERQLSRIRCRLFHNALWREVQDGPAAISGLDRVIVASSTRMMGCGRADHGSTDPARDPQAHAMGLPEAICNRTFRATGITACLEHGGTIEHAQQIANHDSPNATKLYDRTTDQSTRDEAQKIGI